MSTNASSANAPDDKALWSQPRFISAAVIVGLIAVLGAVLVLSGSGDKTNTPAAAAPVPAPTSPDTRADGEGACSLPSGDQTVPTGSPSNTRWELVGRMIAPTAPKAHGPGREAGGFRTCFARSPIGVLYATVNFWAAGTGQPPAQVYRNLAAPSKARTKAINAAEGKGPRLNGLQVAGFAFSSYDPDRASVKLAFRVQNGRLYQAEATMIWKDGDWRYEVPLDQAPPAGELKDLNGFVTWNGS